MAYFTSDLSGEKFPSNQKIQLLMVRNNVLDFIKKDYPDLDETKYISLEELTHYRQKYIESSLKSEYEHLSSLEKEVLEKIKNKDLISGNIEEQFKKHLTIGEKTADKVASFGGSWKFIICFFSIILLWILANTILIIKDIFDPYPFILLNLFLSCLAAFQAPVIMMSQNRQADKDRERSREDYKVNLKSELELQVLQEKVDHLILVQQQKLFEIQNIQIDMLKDITADISELKHCYK